jgi:hypothetical protein
MDRSPNVAEAMDGRERPCRDRDRAWKALLRDRISWLSFKNDSQLSVISDKRQ